MESEFVSLVENALDFVDRSIDDLERGLAKYSVINFYSGVELFLKARLFKEHWTLCASNVSDMAKTKLASGDFVSIGLKETQTRLSNIVGCAIPEREEAVYETLRKRRNQAVHFYHPDDLKSEKRVAVEQLVGWHFLYKRLTHTWRECFEPFQDRLRRIHGKVAARSEYFPSVYAEVKLTIQKNPDRLRSVCDFCCQHSAVINGKAITDVYRLDCLVCDTVGYSVFLPCECGKPAPRSYERVLSCQWCGIKHSADLKESFAWSSERHSLNPPIAWCGVCGYMDKPSVISVGNSSLCLACYTFDEFGQILECPWCGDTVTGKVGTRMDPGCIRCGFHIQVDGGVEITGYQNDISTWDMQRTLRDLY